MDQSDRRRACFTIGLNVFLGVACAPLCPLKILAASTCEDRCIRVVVTTVKSQTYAPKVELTGSIEPGFSSNVAFRVSGKIAQRLAEVGDHVRADQVLAKIDTQEQQANLDTSKASLASAQALLAQAKTTFERQSTLFKSGYTTRPAFDQAQQQLRTQGAAVESATAALGAAKQQFDYTALKPGVAGIVTARNAEAGQVIQAGQTVFTIAQDGARDAVFDLYESLLEETPTDPTVEVYLQSDLHVATSGTVREISPTVDTASGTVKVKVELNSVPLGMSLGATVVGVGHFKPHRAIALPRGALFRWHDSPAVWLFDAKSHAVTPKVVILDRYVGDQIILSDGLTPGDVVVIAGVQFLHPNQIVALAEDNSTK